jgi:hypothetical protein
VTGTQAIIAILVGLVALASALGVAWAIFRSASVTKLREIDRQLIQSQEMLIAQQETDISRMKVDVAEAKNFVAVARADLTQKAAVDHLLELVIREERRRADEHEKQSDSLRMHAALLKDIVAILKQLREDNERASR